MKRYKLLKDLPTFDVGDVFYINENDDLIRESDNVPAYDWLTLKKFPNVLTEWFEEVNESTRWKLEMHQIYYYINTDGSSYGTTWTDDYLDDGRFEIGNCFQTEEEAKQAVEYLKALAVARGDGTTKFTKDRRNWRVFYDTTENCLAVGVNLYNIGNGVFGPPYFATKEDAQRSIERHKNEWLTIFGVK